MARSLARIAKTGRYLWTITATDRQESSLRFTFILQTLKLPQEHYWNSWSVSNTFLPWLVRGHSMEWCHSTSYLTKNMHDKWLLVRHAWEVRGQSITALNNEISTNQMAFLLQVYNSLHKCKELSLLHKLHMHSLNVVSQTSDLPSKYIIQDALPMGPLSWEHSI